MRNLVSFLWKNNFSLLFVLLEFFSVFLLVQNNSFHRSGFFNSSNKFVGTILTIYTSTNEYLNLRNTNLQLAQENARLRTMQLPSFLQVLPHNTIHIIDSTYKQQYDYNCARVVNNSTNRRNNYLTLDQGYLEGIKQDMAVISSSGVVGVVVSVSQHFCSVMSCLHKDSKISAMLKRDGNIGPLSWDGSDYSLATLNDIPNHVTLKKGDSIVTSGYGSVYPRGITIGVIDSYEIKSGEPFFTVHVKLSTQFKRLSYVYIVSNRFKSEQDSLEAVSQKNVKD